MTYTTTHFALQGLTVWLLLSKKDKVYYKKHRWEFILINLFAALPDLDIFFGYHRSYTHSIIIPTFILLCFMIIGRFNKDEGPIETTGQKTIRFIKLASIMWILHIILDLSWGALLLFWPLDPNLYDLTIYLRFSNQPWLFFPLSLVGIIPDWTIYSPTEGRGIFITNLSQQEREALYGEFIDLYIEQITVHILLILIWIVVILVPAFKRKKKREAHEEKKVKVVFSHIWKRVKRSFSIFAYFIIILGIILGPSIGRTRSISYEVSSDYISTLTYFDPTLGISFVNKPQAQTEVFFQCETGTVPYNSSIVLTNNATFSNFFTAFDNMTLNYYDGNITFSQLVTEYNDQVAKMKLSSFYMKRLIENQNSNGFTFQINETKADINLYLIALVDEWNITQSFFYEATIEIKYLIERKQAQIEGYILVGFGIGIILIDQFLLAKRDDRILKKIQNKTN